MDSSGFHADKVAGAQAELKQDFLGMLAAPGGGAPDFYLAPALTKLRSSGVCGLAKSSFESPLSQILP